MYKIKLGEFGEKLGLIEVWLVKNGFDADGHCVEIRTNDPKAEDQLIQVAVTGEADALIALLQRAKTEAAKLDHEDTLTLCDGCHQHHCVCDYMTAERAAEGDTRGMESLGWTPWTIKQVEAGQLEPEEFL
jgi:hypothetical protein